MLTRHTLIIAMSLGLAMMPSCLKRSAGSATEAIDTTQNDVGELDVSADESTEGSQLPTGTCRTFARSWAFPNAGSATACVLDTEVLTMTCTLSESDAVSVQYYPSLHAFIAAGGLGVSTASKQVKTTNNGADQTIIYDYEDTSGKLLGSTLTGEGSQGQTTTITAWDAADRWTLATVVRDDGCTWAWTRVIDDDASTITQSRLDSECTSDLVIRSVYDEDGLLIFSAAGSTIDELDGGAIVTNETAQACLP